MKIQPNKPIILLADDSDDDVLLMRRVFRINSAQAALQVVHDGEELISYLSGEGKFEDRSVYPLPHLILLDLKMPRRTGFEVLDWLREQPQLKRVVVVVLTSSMARADVNRAYDLGANSFLVKPSEFSELAAMMSRLEGYWLQDNCLPDISSRSEVSVE